MSSNKKEHLESAIFQLSLSNPFYSSMLQELTIKFSDLVPLAGLIYDKRISEFSIHLNADKYCSFPLEQRTAILMHEILHFTHSHIFRMPKKNNAEDDKLQNIAMDMAINQYIQNMPKQAINVKKFKDDKGQPFPLFDTAENYYDLLQKYKKENKEELDKYKPEEGDGDIHNWEEMTEGEKQEMLKDAEKLINRTIEKTSHMHSQIPDAIKDLLKDIEGRIVALNFKQILMQAIKKTTSAFKRESTWNRPNKRYGRFSPGTTTSKFPRINVYIDSSGSMSHKELNECFQVLDGFLKAGDKKCNLGLWHTSLYYFKPYKLNNEITEGMLESGGTDVKETIEHIFKNTPNLALILTDGYFSAVDKKVTGDIIWIILEGGDENHPMKHIGKTITLKGLK